MRCAMYEYEFTSREEKGFLAKQTVDSSVFHDSVIPSIQPRGDESPDTKGTKKCSEPLPLPAEKSPDNGAKPILKGNDNRESGGSPDTSSLTPRWQKVKPLPFDTPNGPFIYYGGNDGIKAEKLQAYPEKILHSDPDDALARSKHLKAGAAAVKEYLSDLPKLATAASGDTDAAFELMMVWKGTSIRAKEELTKGTSPYVLVLSTDLVFTPGDEKDKTWELRISSRTGEGQALRYSEKSQKMEPADADALMKHVSMTLQAARAIKSLRDGDAEEGRAQLKTLMEEGKKTGAEQQLKKIIETEADLIYKAARLRAVTSEEFKKILAETEIAISQSKKR